MSPELLTCLIVGAVVLVLVLGPWRRRRGARGDERDASERERKREYDNVRITNLVDGTTIEGHEAVAAHFESEKQMLQEHGSSIIFEVRRVNLQAKAIDELEGPKLTEIKVDGGFVSGSDTVAAVKRKLRPLIAARLEQEAGARPDLSLDEADRLSFSFSGREMQDDKAFYADHFMQLPVWVQVLVHACKREDLLALARDMQRARQK